MDIDYGTSQTHGSHIQMLICRIWKLWQRNIVIFLNVGKTERECITQIVKEAEEAGYVSLEEKVKNGEALKAGDKVYQVGMQKIIALYHIGEEDLALGMNILCAHIDSPRTGY